MKTSRARAASRGYTMVEIMTSLAILAIGATGVIALQKATLLANNNARMLSTANVIALSWAERLQTDGVQWNNFNNVPDLTDTTWLQAAVPPPNTPNGWFKPITNNFMSSTADPMGADVTGTDLSANAFCTHLRMTQMTPTLIRAEVRVFWDRSGQQVNCNTVPNPWDPQKYGAVFMALPAIQNVTQQ